VLDSSAELSSLYAVGTMQLGLERPGIPRLAKSKRGKTALPLSVPAALSLEQKRGGNTEKRADHHSICFLQQQTAHCRLHSKLSTVLNRSMAKRLKTRGCRQHAAGAVQSTWGWPQCADCSARRTRQKSDAVFLSYLNTTGI